MRKLLSFILLFGLMVQPAFGADQWSKITPAGTEAPGTIDDLMRVNQEALDRLVINYKRGLGVNQSSASALSVLAGELAIPNSSGSIVRWRRTTTATSVTWSDIDTGSEANSTQYYLYATADTDITGMVFKISTSSSAPSGATYYRKIAEFYNNSSGNIERLKVIRPDDGTDYPDLVKGWVSFDGSGTVSINDSYNVSSITDNGTGYYTVTWTNSFSNSNYAWSGYCGSNADGSGGFLSAPSTASSAPSTGSMTIGCRDANGAANDYDIVNVIAIGDRA